MYLQRLMAAIAQAIERSDAVAFYLHSNELASYAEVALAARGVDADMLEECSTAADDRALAEWISASGANN